MMNFALPPTRAAPTRASVTNDANRRVFHCSTANLPTPWTPDCRILCRRDVAFNPPMGGLGRFCLLIPQSREGRSGPGPRSGSSEYSYRIDFEIAPEPTADERKAIAAAIAGRADARARGEDSEWLRVAREEGVAGSAYEGEPALEQITQTGV